MDQETALKLLVEGGTFVFLGVPPETQFGIDMKCWNTEEDFRGIKMIPPGLHYIHYSAVSRGTGDVGARSGFMHFFSAHEFVVRMWDKQTDDMSTDEISGDSVQRLKHNLLHLDRHLAPYPHDQWHKWKLLTSQITDEIAAELSPPSGILRASVDLLPTSDADRPKGRKPTSDADRPKSPSAPTDGADAEEPSPGRSDAKRPRRVTRAEQEDAMLPQLKVAPDAALRFTQIPVDRFPPGSTPEEITKHYLDQSYTLEYMMQQHNNPMYIIGELQFSYICFLIGHSLEAFEHWRSIVVLLCSCDAAIHTHRAVYFHFIRTVEVQIDEMPQEFLADIVMNNNIIYKKLRELFKTVRLSDVDARLRSMIDRLKESLTQKLEWDFSDLDIDDEDERPVVVGVTADVTADVTT